MFGAAVGPSSEQPRLGQLLVRAGVLDAESLEKGLAEQERGGRPLGMTLVELGLLSEQTLVSTLAHQLGLPVASIGSWRIDPQLLERVPADLAERHRCLPLVLKDEGPQRWLYLAMADPSDLEGVEAVHAATGCEIRIVLVAPSELDAALHRHYRGAPPEPAARAAEPRELGPAGEAALLHHLSVSREELLALLAEEGLASDAREAEAARSPRAAPGDAAALDRRRLDELDAMVKLVLELLVESGAVTREELVRRLSVLVHEPR